MGITYIFGLLLMVAQILIPPFANDFIKKMKLRHIASFALFFAGFSCSIHVETPFEKPADEPPQVLMPPYPGPVTKDVEENLNNDEWRCGYEWIMVEGPDGNMIYSQIPLSCDPHADIYQGCPSPVMIDE
jgi:hypothetical protein